VHGVGGALSEVIEWEQFSEINRRAVRPEAQPCHPRRSETMASESSGQASGGDGSHFRHNPNFAEEYPPGWWSAGENIALVPIGRDDDPWEAIQESVWRAFRSLEDSPGHYANMVNPLFDTIGVGTAIRDGYVYVTQNFAAMLEPPPITVEP
jgi:uncharacterized protein YkwD